MANIYFKAENEVEKIIDMAVEVFASTNYNTGDWNTGSCNTGDFNTGWLNTEESKLRLY